MYMLGIPFVTANWFSLVFLVKNYKVSYKIRKNCYRLSRCFIKVFGTRSMVDKYLGKLTFNPT